MTTKVILSAISFFLIISTSATANDIFVVPGDASKLGRSLSRLTPEQGADVIKILSRKALRRLPDNKRKNAVLFVVYGSLPSGTKIVTRHEFYFFANGELKRSKPHDYRSTVSSRSGKGPIVVANDTWGGGGDTKRIVYSLILNGRKIAEKSIDVAR